ncbi:MULTISPECIES: hypothetical protein [Flavobacterium]|uniref:RHS repeat-associated core domain-containing protein n=1 Tax=Flavobacterium jumunjinense TaxID=998845 RepID=A0ABV5GK49_9FLAO|nr:MULTISPECIES: hypothetical protein [Flavobacterium]
MHDPRVGRFFAVDPLFRDYPHNSTYAFSENRVVDAVELEGLEKLIVSEINNENRTAKLRIRKVVLVVNEGAGMIEQYKKISSSSFEAIFKKGNRKLHINGMLQNGVLPTFADVPLFSGKEHRIENNIYELDIEYDVTLSFVSSSEAVRLKLKDPTLYSIASLGIARQFSRNPNTAAKAQVDGDRNTIIANPRFFGPNPTGNMGLVDGKQYTTATESIAHETGIHNMAGHTHPIDPEENAAEYKKIGLKGSVPGNVYPTKDETKMIININNLEINE